jgi:DNA-binding GntR family transcriptional regulator
MEFRMSTIAEEAYQTIREMMLNSGLEPGQRVSQSKLAQELGCSTVPVAEAMRRLQSEGLLVKQPRKMARVRQLSAGELEGLYMVREGLEGVAARLAARRITDEQIEHLRELGRRFEAAAKAGRSDEFNELEVEIHRFIVHCAQCPLLDEELGRLLLIERTAASLPIPACDPPRHWFSHWAVIEAIAHHDADSAEHLMKKHILAGYEDTVRE